MKSLFKVSFIASFLLASVSCGSIKEITYFQDSQDKAEFEAAPVKTIKADVADKLSIVVHSKDPELAAIFNLPIVSHHAGMVESGRTSNNQVSSYTIDSNGNIEFPILGTIHVGGLTREEIASLIKDEIINHDYIKDAIVVVEFANLYISVLGEVSRPGRVSLDKDRVTILDAIAKAGDLTVTGMRRNVKVYREEDGVQKCYAVDLTSATDVFKSPVYYLRQDDVVYVEPNNMKKRQSTLNGNTVQSPSFWISVGSFLVTVTTMALTALRK